MNRFTKNVLSLIFMLALAGCANEAANREKAPLVLKPSSFSALPQWGNDHQNEALTAFRRSCAVMATRPPAARYGGLDAVAGTNADWQPACAAAAALVSPVSPASTPLTPMPSASGPLTPVPVPAAQPVTDAQARAFFEQWFQPWQATAGGDRQGLFTGYYEATLNGSRTRHGPYQYPLRARPGDLVTVDLGAFRPALKGQRIAGRVVDGALKPYEDNRAISTGRLPPGDDIPLVWVDDPIAAVFLQIQGSGVVTLDDGTTMRVGYAAQNGYPYYAIGRELVKRGDMTKDDVSMQSIRAWLVAHPDQAPDILYSNKSYVFFQDMGPGPSPSEGPIGAQGVPLTPGRSMAVDHGRIPYGVPVYVAAAPVQPGEGDLDRLMMAQDTGGAIKGAVRGDFFWGRGPAAEQRAGVMKSPGQMWLLLPKTVQP